MTTEQPSRSQPFLAIQAGDSQQNGGDFDARVRGLCSPSPAFRRNARNSLPIREIAAKRPVRSGKFPTSLHFSNQHPTTSRVSSRETELSKSASQRTANAVDLL